MASLKEIKSRIQSVKSTQKITSAMMMISSAKLKKAQNRIESLYPYQKKMDELLSIFLSSEFEYPSPLSEVRKVKRVAIVAFSSNSSLAGRFNNNVIDKLKETVKKYQHLEKEDILIYPFGDKVAKATKALGFTPQGNYNDESETPSYDMAQVFTGKLIDLFLSKKIDEVVLIYHHFKNRANQILTVETFLPIQLKPVDTNQKTLDYIVEPDKTTIVNQLIPSVLKLKFYTVHSDSVTSEHAARAMAMQIATDNADDLISELTIQHNKLRQQSITNELLDIVSGSFGKKK